MLACTAREMLTWSAPGAPNTQTTAQAPATGTAPVPVPGATQQQQQQQAVQPTVESAVAATPRVKIVSERVAGSISLVGAKLDDLTLLDYRQTVDPTSPNIRLLRPVGGGGG